MNKFLCAGGEIALHLQLHAAEGKVLVKPSFMGLWTAYMKEWKIVGQETCSSTWSDEEEEWLENVVEYEVKDDVPSAAELLLLRSEEWAKKAVEANTTCS